jgi:hypothetical protein
MLYSHSRYGKNHRVGRACCLFLDDQTEEIVHKRNTTEANMLPFYFFADLPKGAEDGVLLLPRRPEFESIDSLARELSKKLKKNMGLDDD